MNKCKVKLSNVNAVIDVIFQDKKGNQTKCKDFLGNILKFYPISNLKNKDFIGCNNIAISLENMRIFQICGYTKEKGLFQNLY